MKKHILATVIMLLLSVALLGSFLVFRSREENTNVVMEQSAPDTKKR